MTSVSDWTSLTLAAVGVGGLATSYVLQRRGQTEQSKQQAAAQVLGTRAQAFDEMRELLDEIKSENARLRVENKRLEESADHDLRRQGERCRVALDHLAAAVTTMQGLLVSEIAKASAEGAMDEAADHLQNDHGSRLEPREDA